MCLQLSSSVSEESCPSAVELQTLGDQKLEKCTLYLQKVEVLRSKMQKRTGRVLDTAASLEILGCEVD